MADRILSILYQYEEDRVHAAKPAAPPKCICYCLTKSLCEKMVGLLNDSKFEAAQVYSELVNTAQGKATIDGFRNGKIDILCATKGKNISWMGQTFQYF